MTNTDKYKGQKVLVIPNPTFLKANNGWIGQGLLPYFQAPVDNPKYISRMEAEEDPNYRQLIPNAIVRSKKSGRILTYPRKGREERLHGMYSLGIGGHIDEQDFTQLKGKPTTLMHIISLALAREILEEIPEIATTGENETSLRGFVYSDATPVDSVHLCVAVMVDTNDEFAADTEEIAGEWKTTEEILAMYDRFESWSKILIDNCIRK